MLEIASLHAIYLAKTNYFNGRVPLLKPAERRITGPLPGFFCLLVGLIVLTFCVQIRGVAKSSILATIRSTRCYFREITSLVMCVLNSPVQINRHQVIALMMLGPFVQRRKPTS